MWPEVGKGTREELEKELTEGVGEGWREWPVDTGQQKWPVGMREGPDQWVKTGQDRLAFLVAL